GREDIGDPTRAIVYCVIPRDLASKLHEPLRAHFADDRGLEVIVEARRCDRRATPERRTATDQSTAADAQERRRIRNPTGRRIADRRALTAATHAPKLPRRFVRYAGRLHFPHRLH